ncbi:hypothetical protein [Geothermobacter hydrogeniphilus]|uniref:hypothetical protein n=1 Tax=Geothermobacter hydrogeniphilus TaxID=1969733 RepID=UPI00111C1676|nr:hypothetical protein [Geothermobacter hydrogeniphilus]
MKKTIFGGEGMGKKLVIILDEETTSKYLRLAGEKTEAEVTEDCEPSGSSLTIHISPTPYDSSVCYEDREIGIASVCLEDA